MKGLLLCPKKTSFLKFLSAFVLSVGFAFASFTPVSAYTIIDFGNDALSDLRSTYGTTSGVSGQQGTSAQQNLVFTMPYDYTVNNFHFELTEESIPANSIIHFTISYTARKSSNVSGNYVSLKYFGLHLAGGLTILSDSCFEAPYEVAQIAHTFSCSYTAFLPYRSNYISSSLNTRIIGPNDNTSGVVNSEYQTQLVISPISWFTLSTEALSQTDLNNLSNILQSLPSGASKADIQSAVESAIASSGVTDAINNPDWRDEERRELNDTADSAQDSVDSSQNQVDSVSSSLISQVSSFITGLRQVQPSNCIIAFDLFSTSMYGRGPSANSYNVDLCSLTRPPSFDVIDRILLVVWYIGAILMVLNAILSLFREVQGGDE